MQMLATPAPQSPSTSTSASASTSLLTLSPRLTQLCFNVLQRQQTSSTPDPAIPTLQVTDSHPDPDHDRIAVPGYDPLPPLDAYVKHPPAYTYVHKSDACPPDFPDRRYFIAPPLFAAPTLHPVNLSHIPFLSPVRTLSVPSRTDPPKTSWFALFSETPILPGMGSFDYSWPPEEHLTLQGEPTAKPNPAPAPKIRPIAAPFAPVDTKGTSLLETNNDLDRLLGVDVAGLYGAQETDRMIESLPQGSGGSVYESSGAARAWIPARIAK